MVVRAIARCEHLLTKSDGSKRTASDLAGSLGLPAGR